MVEVCGRNEMRRAFLEIRRLRNWEVGELDELVIYMDVEVIFDDGRI